MLRGFEVLNTPRPHDLENEIKSFEIKTGEGELLDQVKESFLSGRMIQFIGKNDSSLYVTSGGHDNLRIKNGMEWKDITIVGTVFFRDGEMRYIAYLSVKNPGKDLYDVAKSSLEQFFKPQ